MSKQYPGGIISKTPVVPSGSFENSTASGIWTLDQQAYWKKLGQWPIPGNVAPDAQFNYVSMLLHGDGTNGAQNNTFLDSSTNNFTITRNGNTTQGSFSPYGPNWSNYFDGVGDRLSVANNAAFYLLTNSFTIECWVYLDGAQPPGEAPFLFGNVNTASGTGGYLFYLNADLKPSFYYTTAGTLASGISKISSTPLPLNTWTHFAVSRNGNDWNIFVNGVSNLSTTDTNQVFSSTNAFTISGDFIPNTGVLLKGYISNLRVVNGTAVYTSNFTPPTAPLTAITNTVLLTCQSNRFVDNSTNGFAVTPSGDTRVQRFNPFGTTTAYSTSVIGGSGYFDGSGDYLQSGNEASLEIGTGNFTIEMWAYRLSGTNNGLFQLSTTAGGFKSNDVNNLALAFASGGLTYYANNNSYAPSVTVNSNDWNHLALVRSGTTTTLYFNGVSVSSITDSTNYTGTYLVVGGYYDTTYVWNGYISNFRIVKGTAVYTSAFTPPTAPVTAITNTQLLLNYTNGAIFDNAMINNLETVGNAQISTSVKKYGTGSLAFDGTGDYLVSAPSPNNILGGGDFTIEFWLYPSNTSSGYRALVSSENYSSTTGGWSLYQNGTTIELWISSGNVFQYSSAITASTWQHLALSRASGTLRLFINGTQVTSVSNSTSLTGQQIWIGDNNAGSYFYEGYLDDLRITKYARYTANFTPPTSAFPNTGPT
jgi:hypothetical protein